MAVVNIYVPFETLVGLAVLAVLVGFLYSKHRQQVSRRRRLFDSAKWTGSGIDVTSLRPAVQLLRQDYLAARQPATISCYHRSLLGLARHAVSRLPYFRDREAEQPAHR